MGFFDKIFGEKAAGSGAVMKGWITYDGIDKVFLFSYPPEWIVKETDQGIEIYPPDAPRVMDPALEREVADPRVIVKTGDVADPGQNILKDLIRSRSGKYNGYIFVKHHSKSIPKAVHGVIYEFQYGTKEQPFSALSAIAQSKNRLIDMTAFGTVQSFDRDRSVIEGIVFSFRVS
jgi:hypothetical protein